MWERGGDGDADGDGKAGERRRSGDDRRTLLLVPLRR